MPFAAQHQYVNVIGSSYQLNEHWQFGFRITDGGASNEATALALAPIIEAWWRSTTYPATAKYNPDANHTLTELKCARIGTDGLYPGSEVAYSHFYLPPIPGPINSNPTMLPQGTTCVTLTTAVPRGLGSKGRMFLPPAGDGILQGDGRITTSIALQTAKAVGQLITTINAATLVGNVQVMSRGKAVATYDPARRKIIYTYPNPGVSNNVTGVQCGRVIDTQRSRRRSLLEERQSAPV